MYYEFKLCHITSKVMSPDMFDIIKGQKPAMSKGQDYVKGQTESKVRQSQRSDRVKGQLVSKL